MTKKFTVSEIQGLHVLLCNPSDIFAACPKKWGSIGPTVVNALRKWLILIFSETTNVSSFKIYHGTALNGLYMFTGKDVTSYFRTAENRINVLIFGQVRVDNGSTDSDNVCSFGNCDSSASFPLSGYPFRHCCSLTPKNVGSSGPTVI